MITTTKAIVLKSADFQESSKIITVLSEKHGKISLMARGVKKPKSNLAGLIEIGNMLDVVYYYKGNRGIQNLTQASINYQSLSFRSDFEKAALLYASLELISQLVHENEEQQAIYAFSENLIRWLGEEKETKASIFVYVQIRLAELMGIGLDENIEHISESVFLNISGGLISNSADSELSYKLTSTQSMFLKTAINSKNRQVFSINLENGELKQLIYHLDVYFKYHFDGYKERKSDSIFEQILIGYN